MAVKGKNARGRGAPGRASRAVRRRIGAPLVLSVGLFVAGLSAVGCAPTTYGGNPFQNEAGPGEIRVTVVNQSFNDATVHALWRVGGRVRLGTVSGNSSRTFNTPYRGDVIRFDVDFLAGGGYTTGSYAIDAGDHLELRLRP